MPGCRSVAGSAVISANPRLVFLETSGIRELKQGRGQRAPAP